MQPQFIKPVFDGVISADVTSKITWFAKSQSKILQRYKFDVDWLYPCLLVQIGSGISILKISSTSISRIDGSAVGGGVFANLARLVTQQQEFDALLEYERTGNPKKLSVNGASLAAPFFHSNFTKSDVVAALADLVAENAAQLVALNCKLANVKRVVFAGGFISNQPVVQEAFQSVMAENGLDGVFLVHDAVLGCIGALLGEGLEFGAGNDEIEEFVKEIIEGVMGKEESDVQSVEGWEIQI